MYGQRSHCLQLTGSAAGGETHARIYTRTHTVHRRRGYDSASGAEVLSEDHQALVEQPAGVADSARRDWDGDDMGQKGMARGKGWGWRGGRDWDGGEAPLQSTLS